MKEKIKVKIGDRVELIETDDSWTSLQKGSRGTVTEIEEDQDLIWVNWDNGERLALLIGTDRFKVIKK
ncbi:MAG: DUF4314 domain-containing protein [Candidatus Thermoplasmatota archaeon]|nr:DUF4314 domain-containing protein [Candidatus Thermoplasmatota archaeon]